MKSMSIRINLIGWKRPYYFKKVIKALEKCYNIEKFSLLLSIDGGFPEKQKEQVEIFKNSSLSKLKHEICVHKKNLGCAGHVGFAFNKSFESGCDAVITIEDDTVPAKDFLIFMEYCLKKFENDKNIFSISGYHPRFKNQTQEGGAKNIIEKNKTFGCYGTGIWKRIYNEIGKDWFGIKWVQHISEYDDKSFDLISKKNFGWVFWKRKYKILKKQILSLLFGIKWIENLSNEKKTNSHGEEFLKIIDKSPKGSWSYPMNQYWRKERSQIYPTVSRIQNIGIENATFRNRDSPQQKVDFWSENHSDKKIYKKFKLIKLDKKLKNKSKISLLFIFCTLLESL